LLDNLGISVAITVVEDGLPGIVETIIIEVRLHVLSGRYVWEVHSRHSMLPSLLPFHRGHGGSFLLEFEL